MFGTSADGGWVLGYQDGFGYTVLGGPLFRSCGGTNPIID